MVNKKITQLNPADLEAVELSAVEDYPFMQVIAGDKPVAGGVTSFQSSDGKYFGGHYEFTSFLEY